MLASPNCTESGHMRMLNALTNPSSHISMFPLSSPTCSSHSPLESIKWEDSRKSNAPLSKESLTLSWEREETMVKSKWLSNSWPPLSKSLTSLPQRTPFKSLLTLLPTADAERTPLELDPEELLEDKLSMCPPWEESTKLSSWSVMELESQPSETSSLLLSPSLTRSLTPPR